MKTTKQLTFFISILLMFSSIHLKATHLDGLQLSYKHLSGSVYRISLTWYRDCSTMVQAPASMYMNISSLSCNVNQTGMLLLDAGQTAIITITCPYDSASCFGGNAMAYEKLIYENDITLNGQCSDWLFEVTNGGRNAAITTLQNPGADDIYVAAQLNNVNADNNSPQFTNDPIIFVCVGQEFHYNHGMYDADGDSISYHLIAPRTAANIPVTYNLGYSYLNPCSSNPAVSFNDFTGDLVINSTTMEVAVLAFEIKDWRNGELVGSVIRDVIMYTVPCGNYPTATGMNGTTQQILYVLPDDTVCFDILSDDFDVNDTVTMTWNQTIPNATFVTNGIPHPTGTFCWIPTINEVRSQPYMFTAMVYDNTCPAVNACIYSYFIYVTLDSSLVWAGVESPENIYSISPNPTKGEIRIQSSEKIFQIKIFNDKGACIRNEQNENVIDISQEPAGIYMLEFTGANGKRSVQKIVKTAGY